MLQLTSVVSVVSGGSGFRSWQGVLHASHNWKTSTVSAEVIDHPVGHIERKRAQATLSVLFSAPPAQLLVAFVIFSVL